MKFKAKLEDPRALSGVLQICHSIQSDCIVRLQSRRTRFFITRADNLDVQVWMGCPTEFLFKDFRCDSHYKEQSITCKILALQQFMHILKQANGRHGENVTIMRLARNGNTPILKLTMQGASQNLPDLSYDVPVGILSDRDIESIQTPPLDPDHVQVVIPSFAELTTFVDKIKSSACDCVTFNVQGYSSAVSGGGGHKRGRDTGSAAPRLGLFQIYAENVIASFSLKYDAVEMIPRPRDDSDADADSEQGHNEQAKEDEEERAATVTVEVKKFAKFLSAIKEINPTRASLYLVAERALVLSVHAPGSTNMVAYIPAWKE